MIANAAIAVGWIAGSIMCMAGALLPGNQSRPDNDAPPVQIVVAHHPRRGQPSSRTAATISATALPMAWSHRVATAACTFTLA
jgi:hypothetical protein